MAVCIGAAFCMGKWLYERKSVLWCIIGFGMMVWSFDTYQSFLAFYIGIVLISYICECSSGMNPCGWREGILHVMFFVAGYVVSQLLAIWICQIKGGNSGYVNGMMRWNTDCKYSGTDSNAHVLVLLHAKSHNNVAYHAYTDECEAYGKRSCRRSAYSIPCRASYFRLRDDFQPVSI